MFIAAGVEVMFLAPLGAKCHRFHISTLAERGVEREGRVL